MTSQLANVLIVYHILTHGMSMYHKILQDDTSNKPRAWILKRNKNVNRKDNDVIENEHRWSFTIGANDDPIVTQALKEITTHEQFCPLSLG